jgi:anthranilate synthase
MNVNFSSYAVPHSEFPIFYYLVEQFRVGNLFEVVLSQAFRERLRGLPSRVFQRLRKRNPSPYGFFMNLGDNLKLKVSIKVILRR